MLRLIVLLFVVTLSVGAQASTHYPNIGDIIERMATVMDLPVVSSPKVIREVSINVIMKYTQKRYARATYLCVTQELLYAPGNERLIPHEIAHLLQCAVGENPATYKNERWAAQASRIYWQVWGREWPTN